MASHQMHDLPVSVCGGEVEGRVVAHVGRVDARAARHQHLRDLHVPALRSPVQR